MIMLDEGDQRAIQFKALYDENKEKVRKQIQGRKLPVVSRIQDSVDRNTTFSDFII